jgi:NRAMP (natural resistance-associated macrophage protein)-like metal ion transporter
VQLIAGCFSYELAIVNANWADVGKGFIPKGKIITDHNILYAGIGILGATVMPHNLYLHSSTVQTRSYPHTTRGTDFISLASAAVQNNIINAQVMYEMVDESSIL